MSLRQKAMIVTVTFREWTGVKKDRKATQEVAENHGFSVSNGKYMKNLVAKNRLAPIKTAMGTIRNFVYENTLPWKDGGQRLLPTKGFTDFMDKLNKLKDGYEKAVRDLQTSYDAAITEAESALNGLFSRKDYPDDISSRFSVELEILPVPEQGDFRCEVSDAERSVIRAEIEKQVDAKRKAAMTDLWKRMYTPVKHMAERLSEPKAIFRDTLVENVISVAGILNNLNIEDDPEIEKMRKEILEKLVRYDAETLRENRFARVSTAHDAAAIMKKIVEKGGIEIPEEDREITENPPEEDPAEQPNLFEDGLLFEIGA